VQDGYISIDAVDASVGKAVVNHLFRLNSLYDPEFTLGGDQPFQFDQVALHFYRYQVYGAKCLVTFYNPTVDGMTVGCRLRTSTEVATGGMFLSPLGTEPRTMFRQLNDSGSQRTTFSFYVRPRDILGVNATQYQDLVYSAVNTQNPPSLAPLLEPFAVSTTTAAVVRYSIRITYYSKHWEPLTVPAS
jgi:hypothetical protein